MRERERGGRVELKKYMVSSKLLMKIRDCSRYVLTSLVGDWEGTLVGRSVSILRFVGSAVGFRGDWLGLDVGCSDVNIESKKYHVRYPSKLSI